MWFRRSRPMEDQTLVVSPTLPVPMIEEYRHKLDPAPTPLISDFLRYAAAELPWRIGTIQSQDVELAMRAAREHFSRTYPHGEKFDWAALADNCRHRILFVVLDNLDFTCPSLGHLVSVRETTREELQGFFEKAASNAEARFAERQVQYDTAQREASRGMNYAVVTPIA